MRAPSRPRPTSLFRYSPLVAALAGALAAPHAIAVCVPVPPPSPSPVYCVTNINPTGLGSLAQAVADATNIANCGGTAATINFDIAGAGPFTIQPAAELSVSCPTGPMSMVIDGYTQAGSSPNTASTDFNANIQIIVDGTGTPAYGGGLSAFFSYGGQLIVRGMQFSNYAFQPGQFGTSAVSGPVFVFGSRFTNNNIGVAPFGGASPAFIGTGAAPDRNVFGGNTYAGILVAYGGNVKITNNFIGTGNTGTVAAGNGIGVALTGADTIDIVGNVISGNTTKGVFLDFSNVITVTGNKIGVGSTGAALPNTDHGIASQGTSTVVASNNTIANNGGNGIDLPDGSSHTFRGNRIFANGVKAISLGGGAVQLPNDSDDPDTGANELQNYPVISLVVKDPTANDTTIFWSLNSVLGGTFAIDFFSNPSATVQPQATTYLDPGVLGFTQATANTAASTTFFGTTVVPGLHDYITATATETVAGQTSELGAAALAIGVDLNPTSLAFGNVAVNTSSTPQSATLTSIGAQPYMIAFLHGSSLCYGGPPAPPPICSTGEFICSTDCAITTPYSGGSSCSISATFAPITLGPQTDTIYICDNAGGNPRTLTLSGTGVALPPTLTPLSIDFGSVTIGTSSSLGAFTLTNPGAAISLSSFTVTPPFSLFSTTCGPSLPAASSCTGNVKFTPVALGPAAGTIQVTAGGLTLSSGLAGNGVAAALLSISPAAHDFGSVLVGAASAARMFQVQNPTAVPASLLPLSVSGPFQLLSTTCGSTLPAVSSCNASVRFVPTATGLAAGALIATASGGSASASLTGNGLRQAAVEIPTSPIDFGSLPLGAAPVQQSITLRNTGNATLGINSIAVAPPFTLTNACPSSLGAGESCILTVGFDPTAIGDFAGFLSLSTNAPGAALIQVRVHAAVQARPEPLVRVTPRSIGFGSRMAGTQSPSQRVTITNEGGLAATLDLSINMPHFLILNTTCGVSLAPQSTCFADLAFQPHGFGPRRAHFDVSSNSPDSPQSVDLSGAGCRPVTVTQGRGATPINCAP